MVDLKIDTATVSDMTGIVQEVTPSSEVTDAATGTGETTYQNSDWSEQWGYFNNVPELKSALIMKSIWNVGKGYTTDDSTAMVLENIRGWGKDTFNDILFNMDMISRLAGDSYAEIIKDASGEMINLKPLDPGNMRIVVDSKGILVRYEQMNKAKVMRKFAIADIFHLSHNRLADQIHGISDITSLKKTITAEFENFDDMKKIMHRQAKPMIMFKLGTDDQTKINAFIAKMDEATNKGENIYIPEDDHTVSYEVVQVNVSQMILAWRDDVRNKFYRALGLPQIVFGSAGTTESGGKMEYLAHEQVFESDQTFLERQLWNQLAIKLDLISPVSLLQGAQEDEAKDADQGLEVQPNDVTAGVGA